VVVAVVVAMLAMLICKHVTRALMLQAPRGVCSAKLELGCHGGTLK